MRICTFLFFHLNKGHLGPASLAGVTLTTFLLFAGVRGGKPPLRQDGRRKLHPQQPPVRAAARVQLDPLAADRARPGRVLVLLVRGHGILLAAAGSGAAAVALSLLAELQRKQRIQVSFVLGMINKNCFSKSCSDRFKAGWDFSLGFFEFLELFELF